MDEESLHTLRYRLGNRIRVLRVEKGYSLRSFALMIGVDHAYLSRSERGEKNVNIDFLLKVANGLDIQLNKLFEFESELSKAPDNLSDTQQPVE